MSKVLILGAAGKMGSALHRVFGEDDRYTVVAATSADFSATDHDSVTALISDVAPELVINAVGYLGIDRCEEHPEEAYRINTLFPRLLAQLSNQHPFVLVHISTDAVFSDRDDAGCYVESDSPDPVNLYGLTKYGADNIIANTAAAYYIARISLLFGESGKRDQFVEKMVDQVVGGKTELNIADDVMGVPSYSRDIAASIKEMVESEQPYGLYHVANQGRASLYELIEAVMRGLKLEVTLNRASCDDFPMRGNKNRCTPIESERLSPLRPWREGVTDYCDAYRASVGGKI